MLKKFNRSLSLTEVVIISISGMLGSGIFVLPGIVYPQTGSSLPLAYLIAALGVLPTVFSKSELSTAMPASGGTYIYVERTLGPLAGTIAGLGLWISLLLKCAFALTGFGAYLSTLTSIDITHASLILLGIITTLNIFGVGKVARTLFVIVLVSILTLTGTSLLALQSVSLNDYTPFFSPHGLNGTLSAAATVFISYAGVTKIAAIAGEVKDPEKGLPRGMLYSLFIATSVYCIASIALVGLLGEGLAGNLRPFFTLGHLISGKTMAIFLSCVAILTMTSMANAGLLAASRFPYAMGHDKLLPSFLGKISKRFITPMASILTSMFIITISILLGNIENIAKVASAFMIVMFFMVNASVIILREARVQWYRPTYESPLYPLTQIFGLLSCSLLLWNMGVLALKAIVSLILFGSLVFIVYSKKRTKRKGVVGIRSKRSDFIDLSSGLQSYAPFKEVKIVVALFGHERSAEMLTEMGIALSNRESIEVAHIMEIPEQTDLNETIEGPNHLLSLRRRITAMSIDKKCPITFDSIITHDIVKTIYTIGLHSHCQWFLIEWIRKPRDSFTFHGPMGWAKKHLKCNLAIFRDTGIRYIRKILGLIRHDQNDTIVVDIAKHLADVFNADITLLSYDDSPGPDEEKRDHLQKLAKNYPTPPNYLVLRPTRQMSSLISQTMEFDLLVLGGDQHQLVNNFILSKSDSIIENAACSVISVQSY